MSLLRKFGEFWKGMVQPPPTGDGGVFEGSIIPDSTIVIEEQEKLISLRQDLISCLATNNDPSDIIKDLIEIQTDDFAIKYALLNVKQLLGINNQSVKSLQNIVSGLSMISKYAQLLLRKKDQQRSIPLSNPHVQSKILPMNGNMDILAQLGYSNQTEVTISFPNGTSPDENIIVNLLADMLLFKAEMKYYLSGSHICPHQIDVMLPPHTLEELHRGDSCGPETLDMSMQSEVSDNSKNSNDSSPYYSAVSGNGTRTSSEFSPKEGALSEKDDEIAEAKVTHLDKEGAEKIVTMQDYAVGEKGGSETTSLKTPSSGFKIACTLCSDEEAQVICKSCMNKLLCETCDTDWHRHPSRRNHSTEKIGDLDPSTVPSIDDNIVKGPYGIIAQTENPVALITKRIQAAAAAASASDKSKKSLGEHDGDDGNAGNVPNFGSILNMETFADDSQQQQKHSPRLKTRGGNDDNKIYQAPKQNLGPAARNFPPQFSYQQHPQQQQQHHHIPLQQNQLPQFLQHNENNNAQQHPHHQSLQQQYHHPYNQQHHLQYLDTSTVSLSSTSQNPSMPSSPYNAQIHPLAMPPPFVQGPQVSEVEGQSVLPTTPPGQHHPMSMQSQPSAKVPVYAWQMPISSHSITHPAVFEGHPYHNVPLVQGQPRYSVSGMQPAVSSSSSHGFQQYGGGFDHPNRQDQFYHALQQQQQLLSLHSQSASPQGNNKGEGNIVGHQQQHISSLNQYPLPTSSQLHPQIGGYYRGSSSDSNSGKNNSPVSFSTPYVNSSTHMTNFWDGVSNQRDPQQHKLSQSSLGNYPDEEETFIQYPGQSFMKTSGQHFPVPGNQHPINMQQQNNQMPFPQKHSQSYPQLSAMTNTGPDKENFQHQQQQLQQKPKTPMHSSHSTPALSALNPTIKIIQRIKSEPHARTRQSLCCFKIDELDGEIDELNNDIDELLINDEPSDSKRIESLMGKRKEKLKMKKEMQKFLKELKEDNLEIYYPPNMNSNQGQQKQRERQPSPAEVAKPGMRRSPTKEIPQTNVENVAGIALPPSISKGTDTQSMQPKLQKSHAFNENVLGAESMTNNMSYSQLSAPQHSEPPQLSLKADNSIGKSGSIDRFPSSIRRWQCEHCTFLNEENVKVCIICDKTTDNKKYCIEKEDAELDFIELENKPDLQVPSNEDFVAERVQRRILHMQKEEEKMMAEKKKAWEEYNEQTKHVSPTFNRAGSTSDCSNSTHSSSIKGGAPIDGESEAVAGFSELAGKTDTEASGSNTSDSSALVSASLALGRLKEAQACDILRRDGEVLLRYMKDADLAGYPVDAVPIALSFYNSQTTSVMEWLIKHWENNCKKIVTEVMDIAAKREQNSIGQLSILEAEVACIECQGNLKNAVDVCIQKREDLFKHLNSLDSYPREEILQVMYTQRGDKEKAEQELVRLKMEAFVERVWKRGESLQNMISSANYIGATANRELCVSVSSSAIEHLGFQEMIRDAEVDRDRRIRMIWVECNLKSWGRGEMVINILDTEQFNEHVTLNDIVEAVRNCTDTKSALAFLKQECQICFETFPMGKIVNLNFCNCKLCSDCLRGNFEVVLKEKHVRHWTCPVCNLPDMNNEEECHNYLSFLQLQLSPIIPELISLFDERVRDFTLQKDPSFRWCAHCGNGFLSHINEVGPMTCDNCGKMTCFSCKREWEPQHLGLTCEEFDQWKIDNDPANQAIGLARHLEVNGIDCPKCKMRYSLAKGGCMHFKCPQCGHEFCSGCNESFNHQGVCKKYKSCEQMGLHCHHPRDCFSFLRDKMVQDLQKLLETSKVQFNTQVPDDQEDKEHCPVVEQKEEGPVKRDEICGREVEFDMAGLCLSHYKEYLTGLINKHALDPVMLMDVQDMVTLLKRYDMHTPSRDPTEADQNYRRKLIKIIKERLPLNRKKPAELTKK